MLQGRLIVINLPGFPDIIVVQIPESRYTKDLKKSKNTQKKFIIYNNIYNNKKLPRWIFSLCGAEVNIALFVPHLMLLTDKVCYKNLLPKNINWYKKKVISSPLVIMLAWWEKGKHSRVTRKHLIKDEWGYCNSWIFLLVLTRLHFLDVLETPTTHRLSHSNCNLPNINIPHIQYST